MLRNIRELAAALDQPRATVGGWVKRSDWPVRRAAPWPQSLIPGIQRWMSGLKGREAAATGDALRRAKLEAEIRKLNAQADAAETEYAKTCGKLLDAAEVEKKWSQIGLRVSNAFQNLPAQIIPAAMSHGLPSNAAPMLQEQIAAMVATVLRSLSGTAEEA